MTDGGVRMKDSVKKLYRSRSERMIAGVCGGVGEYFDLDPTLVRLGFVIFSIPFPFMVLAYLIMMVVIPNEPNFEMADPTSDDDATTGTEE
jgi:phage shock protein PspC (stress-responsive transcriptional regulator)